MVADREWSDRPHKVNCNPQKLLNRYQKYNDEVALAKEYEQDGRVLILAPESLYGLNTLSKSFEGLERMYRAGYAAAEAIPAFLKS